MPMAMPSAHFHQLPAVDSDLHFYLVSIKQIRKREHITKDDSIDQKHFGKHSRTGN